MSSTNTILHTISTWQQEANSIRQHIHQYPEVGFTEIKTQALIVKLLTDYGVDSIDTSFAQTGVVATIKGNIDGPQIGLRADIDALPIKEANTFAYCSQNPNYMHACGHDGHTTMLLMAAKYLCLYRDFAGTAVLFFQPAEEGLGGAKKMITDGVLQKYPVTAIYALHNMPSMPSHTFGFTNGAIMASSDRFYITVTGRGGHAAMPHTTKDPLLGATFIYQGIQSFVARTFNALDSVVVSVTQIHCGETTNVIADEAQLTGTFRTLNEQVRLQVISQLEQLVPNIANAFGLEAKIQFGDISHPVTINTHNETQRAILAAQHIVGKDAVNEAIPPLMGSEDFAFFLNEIPGCYGFIGNGNSAALHNTKYDFNDEIIPYGASYFVQVIRSYTSN